MNIVEKAPARPPSTADGLRPLPAAPVRREPRLDSELETHDEPLDLADIAPALEGNARAVLFRAVGPERQELVANVAGGRTRLAHAFGVEPRELLAEIQRRLRNKPEIVEVARDEAPVQQVVLDRRPRPTSPRCRCICSTAPTAGPTSRPRSISSSIRATGMTNVGMRRLMLRGRRETGIDLVSPSDLRAIYEASAARAASRCR